MPTQFSISGYWGLDYPACFVHWNQHARLIVHTCFGLIKTNHSDSGLNEDEDLRLNPV